MIVNKKFLFLGLTILIFLVLSGCGNFFEDSNKVVLNVYNWGEYISDGMDCTIDVNREFTRRTGIKVNYTNFQDNESLFAKLSSGASNYDVIIPSDYMVGKLIDKGMVKKLDFNNIPNFKNIKKDFLNPVYDITNEYSVPYTWGLIGLFYNKKYVQEEEISWDLLWDDKYSGKILMFDNSRDAFAVSQLRNGFSVNSQNKEVWRKTSEDLKRQKPLVQSYVMDQIFDKMSNEESFLAPYYDGDAKVLVQKNPNIGFVVPEKGSVKFVDAMCIPATSKHVKEAEMYINFMCDEDISRANMSKVGYSSPIFDEVPKSIMNCETFASLSDEMSALLDDLWVGVKVGEKNSPFLLALVLGAFSVMFIFVSVFHKKSRYKR